MFPIDRMEIYDPAKYVEMPEMVDAFVERRNGKATDVEARKMLLNENYFGTMLVYLNKAHGLVSGAVHSTADTVQTSIADCENERGPEENFGCFYHGQRR